MPTGTGTGTGTVASAVIEHGDVAGTSSWTSDNSFFLLDFTVTLKRVVN